MLARHPDAGVSAVMKEDVLVMLQHRLELLCKRWIGPARSGPQIVHHLGREPGAAVGATADHDSVSARLQARGVHILEGRDVAVDDHGNPHGILHRAHELPIGASLVKLAARAAVDRHHANAALFRDLREARCIAVGGVPARPHLERHWKSHGPDGRLENARGCASSRISAEPAWPFTTFFTGQPKLMSMIAAPRSSLSRAASAMTSGSQPASCTAMGCSSGQFSAIFIDWREARIIAWLAIISDTTSPAPCFLTSRRNGRSVIPDIGARTTGSSRRTGPIEMLIYWAYPPAAQSLVKTDDNRYFAQCNMRVATGLTLT